MINRQALLTTTITLLVIMAVFYAAFSYFAQPTSASSSASKDAASGEVSIDMQLLSQSDQEISVQINLNTHSVDLSQFDLQGLVTLEYGGRVLAPSSVPALSGHHAGGTIIFSLNGPVTDFVVRVQGIPPGERKFELG